MDTETEDITSTVNSAYAALSGLSYEPYTTLFDKICVQIESQEKLPTGNSRAYRRVQLNYFKTKLHACRDKAALSDYYDDVIAFMPKLFGSLDKFTSALFQSLLPIIKTFTRDQARSKIPKADNHYFKYTKATAYYRALQASLLIVAWGILEPSYNQHSAEKKTLYSLRCHMFILLEDRQELVENRLLKSALAVMIDDIGNNSDDKRVSVLYHATVLYTGNHAKDFSDGHVQKICTLAEQAGLKKPENLDAALKKVLEDIIDDVDEPHDSRLRMLSPLMKLYSRVPSRRVSSEHSNKVIELNSLAKAEKMENQDGQGIELEPMYDKWVERLGKGGRGGSGNGA